MVCSVLPMKNTNQVNKLKLLEITDNVYSRLWNRLLPPATNFLFFEKALREILIANLLPPPPPLLLPPPPPTLMNFTVLCYYY